jgi:hypothetical protein
VGLYEQEGCVREIAARLREIVDAAEPRLLAISASESLVPVLRGGWSRRQVIGHLIDSASNNHQRFVRAMLADALVFPGYDQDGNVRVQAAQEADWGVLVSLWLSYNRYLAHVIGKIPAGKLDMACTIGNGEPVTLRFVVEDYMEHLLHHLGQIGAV